MYLKDVFLFINYESNLNFRNIYYKGHFIAILFNNTIIKD